MDEFGLIYPMFAMIVLTFAVLLALFRKRAQAFKKGTVSLSYFNTFQGETEPESSIKLSRHFANIFEVPTLFYVACLGALVVGQNAIAFQLLAWAYVIFRVAHAFIHTRSNKLRSRTAAYFASWIVLLVMWVYLVISIAVG